MRTKFQRKVALFLWIPTTQCRIASIDSSIRHRLAVSDTGRHMATPRKNIVALLQKIRKSHSIPISTKIRLMKALVWPVATYGCKAELSERMKKLVLSPLR